MEVKLLTSNLAEQEYNAAYAMLICHANTDKLKSEKPEVFIKRAIKAGHESILEHITLTFEVRELSRACLQELARHRHISLSVESTRHTLKKHVLEDYWCFEVLGYIDEEFHDVFEADIDLLRAYFHSGMSNDQAKYYLREYWPTQLVITLNIRELRHILKLRTSPAALQEFRNLVCELYLAVPDEYHYMLEDCIHTENQNIKEDL